MDIEAFVTTGGCISRLFMTVQCHFSTIFQLNLVVNFIGRINWEYLEQNHQDHSNESQNMISKHKWSLHKPVFKDHSNESQNMISEHKWSLHKPVFKDHSNESQNMIYAPKLSYAVHKKWIVDI
jgi:hypothetical protein